MSAAGSSGLNLTVGDVFPVTRSDLDFTDNPDVLQLAQAATDSETRRAWESVLFPTDEYDWIQTTSGEWLKDEMKVLYSGSPEFDSDELGLITLDWDDVAQVRGHGTERIRLNTPEGRVTVVGGITVYYDEVLVKTDEGTTEFDRGQIISIAPGAVIEWDNWSIKISFGINFNRGSQEFFGLSGLPGCSPLSAALESGSAASPSTDSGSKASGDPRGG